MESLCNICGKDLNKTTECAWTSCPKLFECVWTSCPKLFEEEWDEDRIDIIGSNGNDGDHYNE